uniref:Uncharacterized protein n=1 Tax=Steinernema glaseri TaxID=37863 RepID=A0A1I7ZSL7_9BILA
MDFLLPNKHGHTHLAPEFKEKTPLKTVTIVNRPKTIALREKWEGGWSPTYDICTTIVLAVGFRTPLIVMCFELTWRWVQKKVEIGQKSAKPRL